MATTDPSPSPPGVIADAPAGLEDALAYPSSSRSSTARAGGWVSGMEMPGTLGYASPYEAGRR